MSSERCDLHGCQHAAIVTSTWHAVLPHATRVQVQKYTVRCHLCGSCEVDIVDAHAGAANHLEAATRCLKDFPRYLSIGWEGLMG